MVIGRAELCALIPHAGMMCLLDGVEAWDEEHVVCMSNSHRLADNPLRSTGQLGAVNGIEYGAQAMAVHGGLLARAKGGKESGGYLAALRDVTLHVERLDTIDEPLRVEARQLMRSAGNLMYEFAISAAGVPLLSGRATVVAQEVS